MPAKFHRFVRLAVVSGFALIAACAAPGHRVITQGNDALRVYARDGHVEWQMPWGGIHDLHVLPNGHILVQRGASAVAEIDRETAKVVWEYDAATQNGNQGKRVEVHAFQPLPDGLLMVAESGPARILEVDRDGKVVAETPLTVDHPNPHTDTRLVRKLENGHYLVCHEGDGVVREYERGSGKVVWQFAVPLFGRERKDGHGPEAYGNKCFCALRLKDGNTLVSTGNGHGVLEVDPNGKVVWKISQDDLPSVRLAWVTTLQVLANGNVVIGNCHAGPGQPLLVEVRRGTREVVWRWEKFEELGNSVSNAVVLDGETVAR